jgi:cell division protein FtsL
VGRRARAPLRTRGSVARRQQRSGRLSLVEVGSLVGRDFAAPAPKWRLGRSFGLPLLAGLVLVALGLAALRVRILDLRYALAEALREETVLLEENRSLRVTVRELRDPTRLAKQARERGMLAPARVIEIDGPGATGRRP